MRSIRAACAPDVATKNQIMSGMSSSSRDGVGTTGSASAGCFIEHSRLARLSTVLKAVNAGDRIVKGRIELFACSRKGLTRRQEEEIQRRAPACIDDSPFGPLRFERGQLLLANLTSLMALLFTDYDCTALTPLDFEHCSDKNAVVNTINQSLALIVDRMHKGFLNDFWQTVAEAIEFRSCEIYSLRPSSGTFEPSDNSLMSFHYFFVDTLQGRILFIGSVTKSKASKRGRMTDTDSEVSISQHDTNSNSSKEQDSMGSSLHEGEYCLSSDGGDEEMLE